MILVIAQFELTQESRDRVLSVARRMDADTSREAGCVLYRHAIDVSDPNRLLLSEIWSDVEALRAHFKSAHFRAFREAARELGLRSQVMQLQGSEVDAMDAGHWKRLLRDALA